ncbi:hypothetical protein K501DRAFT_269883 [Backusella circina FSU 941]|nr:hypothetical protein K501DRAFT_280625 [Backusella circina FSU 941]KAI8886329.1 hypothetical protein K501DRAFT_269883 [Backusella circina FSU 941]
MSNIPFNERPGIDLSTKNILGDDRVIAVISNALSEGGAYFLAPTQWNNAYKIPWLIYHLQRNAAKGIRLLRNRLQEEYERPHMVKQKPGGDVTNEFIRMLDIERQLVLTNIILRMVHLLKKRSFGNPKNESTWGPNAI